LIKFAVFRPTWATLYTYQDKIWHGEAYRGLTQSGVPNLALNGEWVGSARVYKVHSFVKFSVFRRFFTHRDEYVCWRRRNLAL